MEIHYKRIRFGKEYQEIDSIDWIIKDNLRNKHLEKKIEVLSELIALLTERFLKQEPAALEKVVRILECDGYEFTLKEAEADAL